MGFSIDGKLDLSLDIAGAFTLESNRTLTDESSGFGRTVTGQTGAAANIIAGAGAGQMRVTGLTGMTAQSRHRFLTITGAATGANNGTFLISVFTSATSVDVVNAAAVVPDANNGAINWVERQPFAAEDHVNFTLTDRAAIKGVAYDAAIPTYQRPTAVGTNVPANLSNIAGKTLDAHAKCVNRIFRGVAIAAADTFKLISSAGNLKHADATDRTGVPINDGADAGIDAAVYVAVTRSSDQTEPVVLGGGDAGKRIFGRTRAGGTSTSPNSVEVEFRAVALGADLSTSVAYSFEAGNAGTYDFTYAFRERLDQLSDTALRVVFAQGIESDANLRQDLEDIRDVIDTGLVDGAVSLAGLLTNTGTFFIFNNLPDGTPSVVEALNTINTQVGNRDYSATALAAVPGLADGQTITASINAIAEAFAGSTITRTIERLVADVNANTSHLLPGGLTYTLDGTNNGLYLFTYWRGILRDPGPAATASNGYEETDTTHITPYEKIKAGESINYFTIA